MKAVETKLLNFLKKSPQFVVPIYQRAYSWSEKECLQLWDDILRAGSDEKTSAHFVGSIVYIEDGLSSVTNQAPLLVIDGQQRLTTVMLIIEALARSLGSEEPLEGYSSLKLRNYYLLNDLEQGEKKFKLILSQTDKSTLLSLLSNAPEPLDLSIRVKANFDFFTNRIVEEKDRIEAVCRGLSKLVIVDISLDRDHDNPQLIFESLNSTGKELSQADLIRNYILMGLDHELQTKLYENYWRPMERDFGQERYSLYFDSFMRHYLTVKTGVIPREREVYDAFKLHARSSGVSVESLIADIRTYAKHYCALALGAEDDPELEMAFHDLQELKVDVAYPFLLEIYDDYQKQILTAEELLKIVRLVESYVFRRAICDIPPNSMNKIFANFSKNIKKDRYLESVQANFLLFPSYRRFPDDEEFGRAIKIKDIYNFRNRSYWLRRLENFGRKERVQVDEYTIEHVMPQNENLSPQWQAELGPEWKRIQKTYLHTLGNLTLTGYNSEYSDRPFIEKRNMKGGFAESPLRLNKEIGSKEHWNEETIAQRAELLVAQASCVWETPMVEPVVLEGYKLPKTSAEYDISNYPYLATEPLRSLFNEFRKQVLALDPCVTETYLKQYIAYKAETNFVDIVPQAKRLRLSMNLPFPEINDPKGVCKDITALGRWGNGDVEVGLSCIEEIPYVMSLVRQTFDRQMEQDAGGATDRAASPKENNIKSYRDERRREFWDQFLAEAKNSTDLLNDSFALNENWLGGDIQSGFRGVNLSFLCVPQKQFVWAGISFHKSREEAKRIYNFFAERKTEIEKEFGGQLEWNERADNPPRATIGARLNNVDYLLPENKERVNTFLLDAFIRIEKAFKKPIEELKNYKGDSRKN